MLLGLLLTLNILVCLALIGVVLLQQSEGGALGGGGSPTGLVTSRGAGDLLTRTTWILFSLFLVLSLALTLLGGHQRSSDAIINRLKGVSVSPDQLKTPPVPAPTTGAPVAPAPTSGAAPAAPPINGAFLAPPKPVISLPPVGAPAKPAP